MVLRSSADTFESDCAALTLDIIQDAGTLNHKAKRKRGDLDMPLRNILRLQLMMSQPTDSIGAAIPMTAAVVQAHTETMQFLNAVAPPIITRDGPLKVPIVTVEDDNRNLVFDRPGRNPCVRGGECLAFLVPGPPQTPLSEFDGPGGATNGMCILCIRNTYATMVQMYRTHGATPHVSILPSFTNLVDCPGGYRRDHCGITPEDQDVIRGGIFMMGSPGKNVPTVPVLKCLCTIFFCFRAKTTAHTD